MMWDDQRAVNDQQWKKITRVERYLVGENYLEPDLSKLTINDRSNSNQIPKRGKK